MLPLRGKWLTYLLVVVVPLLLLAGVDSWAHFRSPAWQPGMMSGSIALPYCSLVLLLARGNRKKPSFIFYTTCLSAWLILTLLVTLGCLLQLVMLD